MQALWKPTSPPLDPLALTKSSAIVPRVSSCGGNPDPCAVSNTTTA